MEEKTMEEFRRSVPELYPRLHRAMSAYLAGSSVEVDDVLQETFLKALRDIESFQGKSGFYTWLYAIARNISIDEFRKRKYEKLRTSTPVEEFELGFDEFADENELENVLLLRKAIAQLPELLRTIVVMKTIDGLSYPEIAETIEVNEETLKNRMFRARKELAKHLKKMKAEKS